MKILECVRVAGKLKIQVLGEKGNVQFPKDLREEGKKFAANVVKSGSFWKVVGDIFELSPISKTSKKETSVPKKNHYAFIEQNSHEGETWTFFVPKSTPYAKEIYDFLVKNQDMDFGECSMSVDEVSEVFVLEALLSKCNHTGYMHSFNYVSKIVKPPKKLETLDEEALSEYFYKGGFVDEFARINFKEKSIRNLNKSRIVNMGDEYKSKSSIIHDYCISNNINYMEMALSTVNKRDLLNMATDLLISDHQKDIRNIQIQKNKEELKNKINNLD